MVVTATFWGFSGNLAKFLMQATITPFVLTQARSLVTAVVLLAFLLLTRPSALRLTRTTMLWAAGFGVSLAATQLFYFSAIERLNVAAAILLEYLAPAIVVVYSWLFLRRSVTKSTLGSLVAVLVGSALVVQAYDPRALSLSATGVAFGVGAAIAFSAYILMGEHLQKLGMGVATQLFYGFTLTTVLLMIMQPPWKAAPATFEASNLALLSLVGVLGTLLPFACFFASLRYIDAGRATIVSTLEPVVAGVVAFVWFGERFAGMQFLGAALVIGAIVALQREDTAGSEVIVPLEVVGFAEEPPASAVRGPNI